MNKILLLFYMGCLSACSSTVVHYYQLPDSVLKQQISPNKTTVVVQVQLADYLQTPSIIYSPHKGQIYFAKKHLWAGDLSQSIAKTIINQKNSTLGQKNFILSEPQISAYEKMIVYIEQFNGTYSGQAIVSGYVQYFNQNSKLIDSKSFNIHQDQIGNGYLSLVNALNEAVKTLGKQL